MAEIKELKEDIERILNDRTSWYNLNPAVYYFLLYNPVFGIGLKKSEKKTTFDFDESLINLFVGFETQIIINYEQNIFPKINNFLKTISRNIINSNFNYQISEFSKEQGYFKKVSRRALRNVINKNLNFSVNENFKSSLISKDRILIQELNNNYRDDETREVYFNHIDGSKYFFMIRKKPKKDIKQKIRDNYNKMSESHKSRFIEFCRDLLLVDNELFKENRYSELLEISKAECPKNKRKSYFLKMILFDIYAFRLVYLSQEESLNYLNIVNNFKEEVGGFSNIKFLKDDHRNRVLENRPGGIHLTLRDKSFQNYFFEFQFLDFHSLILTYFGESKDSFKRNKK